MKIHLNGRKRELQELLSLLIADGFVDASNYLNSIKIDVIDLRTRWYEIVPLVIAAVRIVCDKYLSEDDAKHLDESIQDYIFDKRRANGFHQRFGSTEIQSRFDPLSDFDKASTFVKEAYYSYINIAGSKSDSEISNWNSKLSYRMAYNDGERAKTGAVSHVVLDNVKSHLLDYGSITATLK
jgi:hypothetical protein